MYIAIGILSRLFTREMYKFIENRQSGHRIKELDNGTKSKVKFWEGNLRKIMVSKFLQTQLQ